MKTVQIRVSAKTTIIRMVAHFLRSSHTQGNYHDSLGGIDYTYISAYRIAVLLKKIQNTLYRSKCSRESIRICAYAVYHHSLQLSFYLDVQSYLTCTYYKYISQATSARDWLPFGSRLFSNTEKHSMARTDGIYHMQGGITCGDTETSKAYTFVPS